MAASQPFATVPPADGANTLLEDAPTREGTPQETRAAQAGDTALSSTSKQSAAENDPWHDAQALMDSDEIVEAVAIGHNKGGLLVRWRGLQGFVPASQMTGLNNLHVEEARMAQLEARQGETLQLKFIEVEAETNRLILSERATEVTASTREDLLEALAAGQIRLGVVTNLADFGAFVDLGGVEGLIHISELSWRRLSHPGDVVQPGQKLNVLVMDVDAGRGRVALSRKKLRQDPWLGVEERYSAGQKVSGKVSSVAEFGVFVLLEEGLEGLLHISEMEDAAGGEQPTSFSIGAPIEAQVIYVSERKRRLALTLSHEGEQ